MVNIFNRTDSYEKETDNSLYTKHPSDPVSPALWPHPHTSEVALLSHQGLQLRVINEVELGYEVVVVLVAGVDVGFCTHAADAVKVMDVNVHKHPEEAAQDLLAHLLEVLGERYAWRDEKEKC